MSARPAIAALAGLSLIMLVAPAVVAAIALMDSSLFSGFQSSFLGISAWLASLAHARVFLVLPLVAMVARAKEDS
jgi:ABC-type spermidine/putrescine transport system permease subunit II